jgi:hypothetical protein
MICFQDQEYFMHTIYDIIHIGISPSNLEHRIETLKERYVHSNYVTIEQILNSEMKDEKYSTELVQPLIKVMFLEPSTTIDIQEYYDNKLAVLKILDKHGVDFSSLFKPIPETLESISRYSVFYLVVRINENTHQDVSNITLLEAFRMNKLINNEIKEYLETKNSKSHITIKI